jgi:hypothetical protein
MADGRERTAAEVVIAAEMSAAARLLPPAFTAGWRTRRMKGTTLVAFAAERSPLDRPLLVVSAEDGPIDNLTVPSDVVGGYAPAGAALVTVSLRSGGPSGADTVEAVKRQAAGWFGSQAGRWRHLATVPVHEALPDESVAARALRPLAPTTLRESSDVPSAMDSTTPLSSAMATTTSTSVKPARPPRRRPVTRGAMRSPSTRTSWPVRWRAAPAPRARP